MVGLYIHHETANRPPETQRLGVEEGPAEPTPPLPPSLIDAGQEVMRAYVGEEDAAVPQVKAPGEELNEDEDRRAALLVEPRLYKCSRPPDLVAAPAPLLSRRAKGFGCLGLGDYRTLQC